MLHTANSPLSQPLRARSGARTAGGATWPGLQRELLENSSDFPYDKRESTLYVTEVTRAQPKAMSRKPLPVLQDSAWRGSLQPIDGALKSTGVGMRPTTAGILSFPAFAWPRSFVPTGVWLSDALAALQSCPADALDEGLNKPSEVAQNKAEQLLRLFASHLTDEPDLYAMDESSIALDWRNPAETSGVLLVVEADGAAVLYSRTRKSTGRIRVDDALDLVGEGALQALRQVGIQ